MMKGDFFREKEINLKKNSKFLFKCVNRNCKFQPVWLLNEDEPRNLSASYLMRMNLIDLYGIF